VRQKASYISPVPGGVGPMTITMLVHNTIQAARRSSERLDRLGGPLAGMTAANVQGEADFCA
jgi:methylenetetrahydrofolate dehydrogenase (NADP+)/methenyltetrahydrofolate cyclohydrolase